MISKKRLEADKNLAKNLEEKKVLEIENAHKKENVFDTVFKTKVVKYYLKKILLNGILVMDFF